jgi:UDP-glucose:(heptosyl)LPS alpha-1,3-glucosyltransferase
MRIALVHPRASDLGGVEHKIHQIARGALDAGHEVHYVCERADASVDPRLVLHTFEIPARKIRALRVARFDRLARQALAANGPFDVVHGFGKTSRQDVYSDGSGCIGSRAPGWRSLSPLATPRDRVVARIERHRFTPGNFRKIFAISNAVRRQILERYPLEEDDVELQYPGVDLARFRPRSGEACEKLRASLGVPADAPVIAFLGSEYRRKGLATLLQALARMPEAVALVMGRAHEPVLEAHVEQAQALGVADRCRFLGTRDDPERLLAAADVLAFPTRYDAFGRAVLEAMACGTPVVVSRAAGAAELVSPEAGVLLDDPTDDEALEAALAPFFDPVRRASAGAEARRVAEAYPWKRHVGRVLEVYRSVGA